MPVGFITAGPKSIVAAMSAASLLHTPVPISHHFHGCTALLRFIKWRYIKYQSFTFLLFLLLLLLINSISLWYMSQRAEDIVSGVD